MASSHASNELVLHVLELLAPLGHARSRRMFGGHGIYVDDVFIAIVAYERLYLKTDEQSRSAFEAAHCEAFSFETSKGEVQITSYWSAPAEALESRDEMRPWARRALEAALRAKAAAKPKRATAKAPKKTSAKTAGRAYKTARASTKRSGAKR
jgi:DNA transformation protein